MSPINSTYKARDVEETLDIYFYRPFGYLIALFAKVIGLTPNIVTFLGMMFGIIAGHLFYYNSFNLDIIGIILLILSEALDSADGQLARMTGKYSKVGRILDGVATNFIFISIYVHISLRIINTGTTELIFIVAILSGISHSLQSAIADFYRNLYLMIVHKKGELESIENIIENYKKLTWKTNFFEKLFIRLYINYTKEQNALTKHALELIKIIENKYSSSLPQSFIDEYRKKMKPFLKYHNILTTNTRMIFLIISILINNISLFFIFEIIVLNILLIYVILMQNKLCKNLSLSLVK
ncbi:MAG TPA: CDP-alcohol phosphatidyltransferase family protein [Bacteroidota bacterium]|nr:CDP-alcohol phosphatidyltransferase family protein [Bacteroidota bacterium]